MERGVICLADCHFAIKRGSNAFFVQQVAVITPLSIRRGVGGEAVLLFFYFFENISKKAWIIVWKIVTLHAFSEFKHIKIVE